VQALKARHPILRRFFDDLCEEVRVDTGVPIQSVKNSKVFRIREEDERAAVWYDREHGVVWCCRVLSIAAFSDEPTLYRRFGRFEGDAHKNPPQPAVLLPDEDERRRAGGEQRLENVIAALIAARDAAFTSPQTWQAAVMRDPAGHEVEVGRAYVERERLDNSGEFVTRFVLVLGEWPHHLPRPSDWQRRIVAFCFDADEPVEPAYRGLPSGTVLRVDRNEVPLMQQRLEPPPAPGQTRRSN
jgi:hypothetical protein